MLQITTAAEKTYLLADTWSDVNFGQYIDVLTIQQDKFNDLEKSIKLIAALSDKPEELEAELYSMDLDDFNLLSEQMSWINTSIESSAEQIAEEDFFRIEGKRYIIKKNYKKLSLGEMVSLETILKDPQYNHQEAALGILIRELKADGTEAAFSEEFFFEVVNTLKYKINLLAVYKYINFFLSGVQESTTKTSKGFSIRKL